MHTAAFDHRGDLVAAAVVDKDAATTHVVGFVAGVLGSFSCWRGESGTVDEGDSLELFLGWIDSKTFG